MVEKIETKQIITDEVSEVLETGQEHPLVESLLQELKVPKESIEHMKRALSKALDGRSMINYLMHKVATQNNPQA